MVTAIVTLLGLIIAAGLATDIIERHLRDESKEFCEIECRNYKRIYK